jgi:hypothetical protein
VVPVKFQRPRNGFCCAPVETIALTIAIAASTAGWTTKRLFMVIILMLS